MAKKGKGNGPAAVIQFSDEEMVYRAEEFICPGQDDHGNSVRLTFRCPPIMERELEIIRDNRHLPYKTTSDIVRHAVLRHVQWLHAMEQMPEHIVSGLAMVMEVCRDAEMRSKLEETFVAMDRIIDRNLQEGNRGEALRLMTECKQKIVKMPASRWKTTWLERFTRKYSQYLMAPEIGATGTETGMGAGAVGAVDNLVQFPVEEEEE